MQESFLHYVWKFQYFNRKELTTEEGQPIKIFALGTHNHDSGPDFLNARIHIGAIDWVGNVELHTKASGWYNHGHDNDPAYNNVILHVVWTSDRSVFQHDGRSMPTLKLQGRVDPALIQHYLRLTESPFPIPCEKKFPRVQKLTKLSMLDKTAMHRLENKASKIGELLKKNKTDWEETTYQLIAQNFGFKTNADPFLQLACSIPLKIVLKHGDNLTQIEALLLGQAGFLEFSSDDNYVQQLQREYHILSVKYNLKSRQLNPGVWKFLRLRPANFPTLRIAQFSALIFKVRSIFSQLLDVETSDQLRELFKIAPSTYWHNHYRFEKKTNRVLSRIGTSSLDNLIINTVTPLLVSYGRFQDRQELIDRALHFLQHIPAEKNNIIKRWNEVGFKAHSALESQGLIELYNNFCLKKKCLSCVIGVHILKPATQ